MAHNWIFTQVQNPFRNNTRYRVHVLCNIQFLVSLISKQAVEWARARRGRRARARRRRRMRTRRTTRPTTRRTAPPTRRRTPPGPRCAQ